MQLPTLPTRPVADPRAVIAGTTYRITVLTPGLVRLEHAADGVFEDRASAFALNRHLPVPEFTVRESDAGVEVLTDRFVLTYDRRPFSPSGLTVAVRGGISTWHSQWRFGAPLRPGDNLGGTARTLDDADGAVALEVGVASRNGYAVIDDSASLLLEDSGWVAPRDGSKQDLYVFAYGRDHRAALAAFYDVSGRPPLLPRWALGNWWSRYHPYTADEYTALLDRFAAAGAPFSVAVIDMDWHLVDVDPAWGSGWTGYTWNRELFPDPPAFCDAVHQRGLRVTLNDHPADGVRPFEDAHPALAAALGRAGDEPIPFDVTDPAFLAAWFEHVRRPVEEDGVDFWWMDWQQGEHSRVAGIDPLWMLNHFGYLDNARGGRRPLGFSRYAGPGSHRYPVGFSGDTVTTWASLAFQAEFTATAANIGYGWWSHDIGGHMGGAKDDDLTVRWVQLGVFSPVLRLHSVRNPFTSKEPWNYGPEAERAIIAALRLRHRLVPYLHTMNHRAAGTTGEAFPLVTPMYHEHPWTEAAYRVPRQFAFGDSLVVAPITTPLEPTLGLGSVTAWLPQGVWVDLWSSLVYDASAGDRQIVMHRGPQDLPVLARAGAIVPLDAAALPAGDPVNPPALEVLLVVGADGAFVLVEDDGAGEPAIARTPISYQQSSGTLSIGPATGAAAALPARRSWIVTTIAHEAGDDVAASVDGAGATAQVERGPRRTSVRVDDVPVTSALTLSLGSSLPDGPALAPNDVEERVFTLLHQAQISYATKTSLLAAVTAPVPLTARIAAVQALDAGRALETAVFELLLAAPLE